MISRLTWEPLKDIASMPLTVMSFPFAATPEYHPCPLRAQRQGAKRPCSATADGSDPPGPISQGLALPKVFGVKPPGKDATGGTPSPAPMPKPRAVFPELGPNRDPFPGGSLT